jgi:hypothetical protein
MPAKTNSKRKRSKTRQPQARAASTLLVAMKNLINMATVVGVSGTVLLGLLAANHF